MIINTQFFITYYTGKQPLKLTEVPDNLSDTQMIEYNKLIQSIAAIYGSQNLDSGGTIPKFWTQLVQYTDELGNTGYKYAPHPDSDLTELDPRSSYYFIVRDESALPLRIPAAGGSLLGFTDTSLLPIINNETLVDITLNQNTGNVAPISITLQQLQPYEEYVYQIKSVDANWPINVYGLSGVIKPGTDTASIHSQLLFCPNTGLCGTNILDYSLQESCLFTNSNLYGILQLSIKPLSYDGPEVLSDQFIVNCKDCLPSTTVAVTGDSNTTISFDNNNNMLGFYNYKLNFNNLQPNQTYTYAVETINSEWPTFFAGEPSGTIKTLANGHYDGPPIIGKLVFCKASGTCANSNSYITPNYPPPWNIYSVGLRATLAYETCNGYTTYSDPFYLTYVVDKDSYTPSATINVS